MRYKILALIVLITLAAQDTPSIAITSPASGDVVFGIVNISGMTDIPGFASSQLEFSYASNPADTWFAIQASTQPVTDSPLASWDTSLITNGEYILRLRVFLEDGSFQDAVIPIKVQNDTPVVNVSLTNTPIPAQLQDQVPTPFLVAASPTPTQTPRPTPTPFPVNSASVGQTEIYESLARGALVILGLFVFAGIALRFRRY